jgi:hypothetical protein
MFLYLLVTLVFTWPLCLHLGTQIIGPFHGDNLEYVWKIWWVKHAWFDLRIPPQVVPQVYWPYGYPLAYGEITPLHTIIMLPVNLLLGQVWTYNLAILLSTWLSGWFTYQWLLNLTGGRRGAAFVGGLIFAFYPYRMARIAGHLPLISTEGFPLVLWGIERFWHRHCGRDAGLVAIGVAVSTLSSWYYAFMLAVLAPLYWIVRARPWREWFMRRWFWTGMALSLLVVICAVTPFALWYAPVFQMGEAKIPLAEADFWSASVADYLMPNWRHPLWGAAVRRALTGQAGLLPYEFLLMPGYTVLALALWKSDQARHPAWAVAASVVGMAGAFAGYINWIDRRLELVRAAFTSARDHYVKHRRFNDHSPTGIIDPLVHVGRHGDTQLGAIRAPGPTGIGGTGSTWIGFADWRQKAQLCYKPTVANPHCWFCGVV